MKTKVYNLWAVKSIRYNILCFDCLRHTKSESLQYLNTLINGHQFKPVKVYISENDPRKSPKVP